MIWVLRICFFLFFASLVESKNVVLISGSTRGIGLATALTFQKQGYSVWAGYRSDIPQAFEGLENIHPIRLDVTDINSIVSCVDRIIDVEGRIDVLINNAGYGLVGFEEQIPLDEMKNLFEVNFFGVMGLIQCVTPWMKKQQSGHVINISSTSGVRAIPGLGLYGASKFALEGVSEALAVTLSPWNIKVVLVEPGVVCNDWAKHCVSDHSKLASNLLNKLVALSKNGQDCSEIASLIYAIATNKNPNMRYQTSSQVENVLKEKLTDLSGNIMRDKQKAFFDTLMDRN